MLYQRATFSLAILYHLAIFISYSHLASLVVIVLHISFAFFIQDGFQQNSCSETTC